MSGSSITQEVKMTEELKDDLSTEQITEVKPELDMDKLAALRAKSQAKQQEGKMAAKIVGKKERSLRIGVIGSGQSGGRLAQSMYELGYDAVALNTAAQDLKFVKLPDTNKLLLEAESGIGGAARELSIGEHAAQSHQDEIMELVHDKLGGCQVHLLCLSLGGGSGAGSCETLVDLLSSTGKPLMVLAVLPMHSEDVKLKSNALETLSKLARLTENKTVSNLIVVDNSKIETIFSEVSQLDFYETANKSIVDVFDKFNTLSSLPSPMKPLDSAELTKLFIDSGGLTVYGDLAVENYEEDTALAEAVISNLNGNLLADGFDLKQSKYVGFMVVANKSVWAKIPSQSVNYATSMVGELCGSAEVFKGLYVVNDMEEDVVKVFSYFTGLGLPSPRVEQLKTDVKELTARVKSKDENRSVNLKLDTGTHETVSQAEAIKKKIAAKSSAFGKLMGGGVSDRRK